MKRFHVKQSGLKACAQRKSQSNTNKGTTKDDLLYTGSFTALVNDVLPRRSPRYKCKQKDIIMGASLSEMCLGTLTTEELTWASGQLNSLTQEGNLDVNSVVRTYFTKTNLVRNSARKTGLVLKFERSYVTPAAKRRKTKGSSHALRRDILFTCKCFRSLSKNDLAKFNLLNMFRVDGASKLTITKMGSKKIPQARRDAKTRICDHLTNSFFREDIAEFLITNKLFHPTRVFRFILKGILREKQSRRRKSYSSLECNVLRLFKIRVADHGDLDPKDKADLTKSSGLSSKIITKYGLYLDTMTPDVQVIHSHGFFAGDSKKFGHFVQSWAFVTHLEKLRQCEYLVFPVLESDSDDVSGSHVYLLVCRRSTKRIFAVDVNGFKHEKEIFVLSECLDHHLSLKNSRNPWRMDTNKIRLPHNESEQGWVCGHYAILCIEHLINAKSVDFPLVFNDNDYRKLNLRIQISLFSD